ncbi:cell division cycle protein 16 homolog isoform X2 [Leptidea sinapis]|nr:cell division cycle protein 16 homolog isoform X2 [Leptidea sinapis]
MLSRGELHRAAHAVTSRGLHMSHLLCLGVAMRAFVAAKEPSTALNLMDECYPSLLEPRNMDQTHNRALSGVLVTQARALTALERRDAAVEALKTALRADVACYEALDLLLEQHALTPALEKELIQSLPINNQLNASEAALLRAAYRERVLRYAPLPTTPQEGEPAVPAAVEVSRSRSVTGAEARGRQLAAAGDWSEALKALDEAGPWACPDVRTACLVELKKSTELFAFAHTLVDAYPQSWAAWYAVGCYYYLIGKRDFARRYLSKACTLEASAGCVWLTYGHSFSADTEHDQAMAAYFKASQLMSGSYLPPLYVAVECSILNNVNMCKRFLTRAAILHCSSKQWMETGMNETELENKSSWEQLARLVSSADIAHEAGVAAFHAGDYVDARVLWLKALDLAGPVDKMKPCWASTLDALGHACRRLKCYHEAEYWHERALALRPARAESLAGLALALALQGHVARAGDVLHAALAREPAHGVAAGLLERVLDTHDAELTAEEIPQFPFPAVTIAPLPAATPELPPATPSARDVTVNSDMSMSFD